MSSQNNLGPQLSEYILTATTDFKTAPPLAAGMPMPSTLLILNSDAMPEVFVYLSDVSNTHLKSASYTEVLESQLPRLGATGISIESYTDESSYEDAVRFFAPVLKNCRI